MTATQTTQTKNIDPVLLEEFRKATTDAWWWDRVYASRVIALHRLPDSQWAAVIRDEWDDGARFFGGLVYHRAGSTYWWVGTNAAGSPEVSPAMADFMAAIAMGQANE